MSKWISEFVSKHLQQSSERCRTDTASFLIPAFISAELELAYSAHATKDSQVCELILSEFGKFLPGWSGRSMELFLVGGSLVALLVCLGQ